MIGKFPSFLSKITVEVDIERVSEQSKILAEPNFQLGRESQPKPGADADVRSSLHMQPVTDDSDPLSSSTSQVDSPPPPQFSNGILSHDTQNSLVQILSLIVTLFLKIVIFQPFAKTLN